MTTTTGIHNLSLVSSERIA